MELSKQDQILLVEQNLSQIAASTYNAVIQHRVFAKVKDEQSAKQATDLLDKLEKMKDEYEAILKELETPEKK